MKDISPERWRRLESLLDEMLDLAPEQRPAFLEALSAQDQELGRQVQELIEAERHAGSFLEDSEDLGALYERLEDAATRGDDQLSRISSYRIIRTIGRGGMGLVYLAQRNDDAFDHLVAIKVIRRGLGGSEMLRRFRQERQILASFNHDNIARLYDGGITEQGQSYLVMEYVEGRPITRYCDEEKLTVEERLQIFLRVCKAVHYAHQNLIVHRDLKPSNILVTADGVPKLLDFGIAKLLDPEYAASRASETRTEQRTLTPEYASPEQVTGGTITTGSDVYALGMLLYELLTGHRPYQVKGLSPAALERIITELEPELPSSAVARTDLPYSAVAAQTAQAVGAARSTSVERLRRRLAGDLDIIVMKALRKESEHRYETVDALQSDLQRHLAGQLISARSPTISYRTRKFIRRHPVGVAATALLVLLLITVVVLSVRFALITSKQAERIAIEGAKAQEVKAFMLDLFQESDPENARGSDITAEELLARGAEQIERELAGQPDVQAEMLNAMGVVYRHLGQYDKAQPLLERSLAQRRALHGRMHVEVAQSLHDLAMLRDRQGLYNEAAELFNEAIGIQRQLLGDEHPDLARSMNELGVVRAKQDNYVEAEPLWRAALGIQRKTLDEEDEEIMVTMSNLAVALHELGQFEEAVERYQEVLALQRQVLGEDHPDVATNLYNLGSVLYDGGRYDEAEKMLRDAYALRGKLLGQDHYRVGLTMNWLGRVLQRKGAYAEAEQLLRRSLSINEGQLGSSHPIVARSRHMLGALLYELDRHEEAHRYLIAALDTYAELIERGVFPEHHAYVKEARFDLGRIYVEMERFDEADELLRGTIGRTAEGPGSK